MGGMVTINPLKTNMEPMEALETCRGIFQGFAASHFREGEKDIDRAHKEQLTVFAGLLEEQRKLDVARVNEFWRAFNVLDQAITSYFYGVKGGDNE